MLTSGPGEQFCRRRHSTGKPLRLLILEDNVSDAVLVLDAIRQAGYDPTAVRVETEQGFRDHLRSAPEVILADFSMPGFDALHALEITQESGLDVPFIVVSGTIGEEFAAQVMQRGAADYIIKGRLETLGPAVAQALDKKATRDERRRPAPTQVSAESPDPDPAVPPRVGAVPASASGEWAAAWVAAPHGKSSRSAHSTLPPGASPPAPPE